VHQNNAQEIRIILELYLNLVQTHPAVDHKVGPVQNKRALKDHSRVQCSVVRFGAGLQRAPDYGEGGVQFYQEPAHIILCFLEA